METDLISKNIANKVLFSERLYSLDGWRTISILLVYIQHGCPPSLSNKFISAVGGVGVRFFFVISGFLITWLLLKETKKYGYISIKSFFIRRFLRIVPVLFFYLLSAYFLDLLNVLNINFFEYLISMFFMCDVLHCGVGLGHLWSLGVEEKFYLIWPFIFILLIKYGFKVITWVIVILVICAPFLRYFLENSGATDSVNIFNSHSFFIIYDGLIIGCLGAVLLFFNTKSIVNFFYIHKYLIFIFGAVLIITPSLFWFLKSLADLKSLQDTLQCLGFSMLLLQSMILPSFIPYKILNTTLFKYIGSISYSLYIWMGIFERPNLYNNT